MIHPLAEDITKLKDAELEAKILSLSRKYWQTRNPMLQQQVAVLLEGYNQEFKLRRAKAWEQQRQNMDKGLDKLINVN
jgi:mitochondrial fission protein ELM1